MKISVKSPTRIDLAGGTLDCWPLYLLLSSRGVERCFTLNLSVDIFSQVELGRLEGTEIRVEIQDLSYTKNFRHLEDLLRCGDPELALVKSVVRFHSPDFGFHLLTRSESPVGAGLGGSSSLIVSLNKAFSQLCGTRYEIEELVTLSGSMEAQVLSKPTGTQDYYPAIEPGLNVIEYSVRGRSSRVLPVDLKIFREKMMLVYTGKQHHSGINNWQVIQSAIGGEARTLDALAELARVSERMLTAVEKEEWGGLAGLFQEEYTFRTRLCEGFSSPEIRALEALAMGKGAEAIKICGAGGGGCVILWAAPAIQDDIEVECQKRGFRVLKSRPVGGI